MRWLFHALFNHKQTAAKPQTSPRPRLRLQVEVLEERTLLNARFVVPLGVPTDNNTTFPSLQLALNLPGLSEGDTIQIEPGSTPGNITNADLTAANVADLTIAGDPTAPRSSIPQFTLSDNFVVMAAQNGFTLKHVNVGLIDSGGLDMRATATIVDSSIVDMATVNALPIGLVPGTTNNVIETITDSSLTTLVPVTALVYVFANNQTTTTNVITGNIFTANYTSGGSMGELLEYSSSGTYSVAQSFDQVSNNTFIGDARSNLIALVEISGTVTELTLNNNTFSDSDNNVDAIQLNNTGNTAALAATLTNNTMSMTGSDAIGVDVVGGAAGSVTNVAVKTDQIAARFGTGLFILTSTAATASITASAQGTNFEGNRVGVVIYAQPETTAANLLVDLGGGLLSQGGNDFRNLPTAMPHQGAIVVENLNPASPVTVTAKNNLFSSTTGLVFLVPGITNVTVDTSSPLSANAAFVETLYIDILHRFGDTTNTGDAGYWVNLLNHNTMTPAAVANAIARSAEALGILVDGLYQKFLNRPSDSSGRMYFISLLQNGGTIELAISQMVSGSEFKNLTLSDANFVQTLYNEVLGRLASNSEIAYWVGQLPNLGRAGVANAILNPSALYSEFRTDAVQELYGFQPAPPLSVADILSPLLRRTTAPATNEINYWVNDGEDLLTIMATMAGTGDFFTNG